MNLDIFTRVTPDQFSLKLASITSLTFSIILITQTPVFAGGGENTTPIPSVSNPTETASPTQPVSTPEINSSQPISKITNPVTIPLQSNTPQYPVSNTGSGAIINSPYSGNYSTNQSNCGLNISLGANNSIFGVPDKIRF